MPTYEYECTKCKHVFEEFQSITAAPLTSCPVAGCGGSVRRLISAGAGLLFKGSGFYITDYRSESYKQKAKSDASASAGSSSPSSSSPSSSVSSSPPPKPPSAGSRKP